ncbi:MAG: hypothetical protein HWE13_10640 [Gammaproteobacteria bacterium]|nr:hypothetical protein [Gammaproteobacteria bacterium]NVK88578.1 hypothetical protein [Gammaproteobacteria bacterium]
MLTMQTDVGQIKRILLKHAKDAFRNEQQIEQEWQALNFLAKPDRANAIKEYDAFCELLVKLGVELAFLPASDDTTLDSLYPRDNALTTDEGILLCTMGKPNRASEPEHLKQFFQTEGITIKGEISAPGSIEGGDVTWLKNNVLAVANGYRTNPKGIAQLREQVANTASAVIEVPLPHFRGPSDVFHLMSIVSPIAEDVAVVYSPLMPVPFRNYLLESGYRLVEVPESEYDSQGCNVLAVAPGVVIAVDGNPITLKGMQQAGIDVHVIKGKDICEKGCGGPTCLTRPLERLPV